MEFKSGINLADDKNMLPVGIIKRRMTKEERLKAKERAEAQKNGTLTPDLDADGNPINPHVPKFIADAPWYMDMAEETGGKTSLRHQKYVF
jgi:pre-mRNA-processing factor SLU7